MGLATQYGGLGRSPDVATAFRGPDRARPLLHAFEKRTRATPPNAIELARKRLADLLHRRARQ